MSFFRLIPWTAPILIFGAFEASARVGHGCLEFGKQQLLQLCGECEGFIFDFWLGVLGGLLLRFALLLAELRGYAGGARVPVLLRVRGFSEIVSMFLLPRLP